MPDVSLPQEFISYTKEIFGEERWQRYLRSFSEEPPVSIRFNPYKNIETKEDSQFSILNTQCTPVPWCRNAIYLPSRPNFTLDPLLHAGAYYVQEASSMFLDHVVRQLSSPDFSISNFQFSTILDLCAAPGGKSTLLRAALPEEAWLYSNEPDRKRANILMENMQKQGHPKVIVTNNYPRDYRKSGIIFDMILADVPCSGEGMFRKDSKAIGEWSLQNVMKCQTLQRSIVEDIWQCLAEGGIMVYSTCTFNTRENEENVRWIMENLGAEAVQIEVSAEWNITDSLLNGFHAPVYRFIPGITKGEGLFMAVLRKKGGEKKGVKGGRKEGVLHILSDGNPQPVAKGKKLIPAHAESLLVSTPRDKYPRQELSRDEALKYLRHEALVLPPACPLGFLIVTYQGLPLGFVNNIGNRANNLYPKEWKIKK